MPDAYTPTNGSTRCQGTLQLAFPATAGGSHDIPRPLLFLSLHPLSAACMVHYLFCCEQHGGHEQRIRYIKSLYFTPAHPQKAARGRTWWVYVSFGCSTTEGNSGWLMAFGKPWVSGVGKRAEGAGGEEKTGRRDRDGRLPQERRGRLKGEQAMTRKGWDMAPREDNLQPHWLPAPA